MKVRKRSVRVVAAMGLFAALVAMMAESLSFVMYKLDEWVDDSE